MRIGIVCEGETDVHAIVCFLGASLENRGVKATFVALQPEMDRTSPSGGWGLVFKWLEKNPPRSRTKTFLGGGLFGHGLSTKQCDLIVIQMDADNLSGDAFRIYIKNQFDKDVVDSDGPIERGNEVRSILETVGDFDELVKADRERHVVAPAVESTETWCVAAFERQGNDPELLRGQDLCIAFMEALHRSENRSIREFAEIDKSANRRLRFCRTHSAGVGRLERQCHHYRELVNRVNQVRHHAKGHRSAA